MPRGLGKSSPGLGTKKFPRVWEKTNLEVLHFDDLRDELAQSLNDPVSILLLFEFLMDLDELFIAHVPKVFGVVEGLQLQDLFHHLVVSVLDCEVKSLILLLINFNLEGLLLPLCRCSSTESFLNLLIFVFCLTV